MKKFLISSYILFVSAFMLPISILYAKVQSDSPEPKTKVFIEAKIVQVSNDTLEKLQLDNNVDTLSNVTVPLPVLLYVLANPDAAKTVASAKIKTVVGETGKLDARKRIKYLVKTDEGSFEQKLTDTPIGTMFVATLTIDRQGKILLDFNFEYATVILPEKTDPETSLPIGEPIVSIQTLSSKIRLNSGEPVVAGAAVTADSKYFTLIWAEILRNKESK